MQDFLFSIDRFLFLFINSTLSHPWLDHFFMAITNGRNWIIPLIGIAGVYLFKERKKALIVIGLMIVTVAISDPVACRIIKPLVHRTRPCDPICFVNGQHLFLPGAHFLSGLRDSLSFPSAHAVNIFAQAMLLTLFYHRRGGIFFMIAALVAISRIYIGIHYPSDIAGGALIGMCIGAAVFYLYRYSESRVRAFRREKTALPEQESFS